MAAEEVARADGGEGHDVVAGAEGGDVVGAGAGVVPGLGHLHHVVQLRRVRERCHRTIIYAWPRARQRPTETITNRDTRTQRGH